MDDKQSVTSFYVGKSVFITGGTGFLGKGECDSLTSHDAIPIERPARAVIATLSASHIHPDDSSLVRAETVGVFIDIDIYVLVEKLLRTCSGLETIYILVRAKKGVRVEERVTHMIDNELFQEIRNIKPEVFKKIVPITGDIVLPNLGIKPEDEIILREKVSVVFHSAASVQFNEPLKTGVEINIEGTRKVLELCKRLKRVDAFVHVSTAYVSSNRIVADEVVYAPPMTYEGVKKLVQQNCSGDELRTYLNGHPNTYTFTKAIAENYVLENHGEVPTVIIRPSAVSSIAKDPIPGWLDNWYGVTRLAYSVAQGQLRVLYGDKDNCADLIPVDYVTNLAIVAAAKCKRTGGIRVYHSSSSNVNSISFGELFREFAKETVENGSNDKTPMALFFKSTFLVKIISLLVQTAPAYLSDLWLLLTRRSPKYIKAVARASKLRDSIEFFIRRSWVFRSENTSALHDSLSKNDQSLFPCDVRNIEWKSYVELFSRGVREHLVQNGRSGQNR